jgi:hypothetical protein
MPTLLLVKPKSIQKKFRCVLEILQTSHQRQLQSLQQIKPQQFHQAHFVALRGQLVCPHRVSNTPVRHPRQTQEIGGVSRKFTLDCRHSLMCQKP